jgi:hypothetical protein
MRNAPARSQPSIRNSANALAATQGRRFMTYRDAQTRLRKALAKVAAGAGPGAIIREVFQPR